MKGKHPQKRVNPTAMITTITEIFNPVLKKPALKNLILTTLAIALAKTFRINEIASRLPVAVKHQKTKQKRLLRFVDSVFPIGAVMGCWLVFVLRRVYQDAQTSPLILVDETKLLGNFKAIVAAVPFRRRGIPIYWHIYSDAEIRGLTYKSHNEIIQRFCVTLYQKTQVACFQPCEPVLIFDRGVCPWQICHKVSQSRTDSVCDARLSQRSHYRLGQCENDGTVGSRVLSTDSLSPNRADSTEPVCGQRCPVR